MGAHPIDYMLLRQLVPHYRLRKGNTRGVEQEKVLFQLAISLEPILNRWGIDTFLRKAHFLGQTSVESRDFTSMYEDNNDHTPVDGKRYEAKKNLGNTQAGDGAKYIGRGMLQLTGRDNYRRIGKSVDDWHVKHDSVVAEDNSNPMCLTRKLDLVNHPEHVAEFPAAIETACAYWIGRHINLFADKDDALGVTHCINARLLALNERKERTATAKKLLDAPDASEMSEALRRSPGAAIRR